MLDPLGDKMKLLEREETERKGSSVYVRIDGVNFSKFTRTMERPYDNSMALTMIKTTESLMKAFGASRGYTQSDEISLFLSPSGPHSQIVHGGKLQKIVSRTASHATVAFIDAARQIGGRVEIVTNQKMPEFDSRAIPLDDYMEVFKWRKDDAKRNAVSGLARKFFSHKQLQGKTCREMREMLNSIQDNRLARLEYYPLHYQEGTEMMMEEKEMHLTEDQLSHIPVQHRNESGIYIRRVITHLKGLTTAWN